ncbi:MAG: lipocalin family protein [Bacteroidales bacterium]|nr:lipocalin family protein [Bacteroidales bacterium]MCF8455227.1 lipocalin family protein [Bacteroidales bacterium]
MKLFKLLLVVAVLGIFMSCEEDEGNTPSSNLVGNWRMTELEYSGENMYDPPSEFTPSSTFIGTGQDIDLVMTFSENPHQYTSTGSYVINVATTIEGFPTMSMDQTFTGFAADGSWSQSGNQITFTTPDGDQTGEILELTATKLVLGVTAIQETTGSGITLTTTVEGSYTFEKE